MAQKKPNVAIFVALPEELDAARRVLEQEGEFISQVRPTESRTGRYLYSYRGNRIAIYLIADMGNIASAAMVGMSFRPTPPELALLVGISGSLSNDVGLGDVVVSHHVKYFAPDKIFEFNDEKLQLVGPSERSAHYEHARDGCEAPKCVKTTKATIDDRDIVSCGDAARFLRRHEDFKDPNNFMDLFLLESREAGSRSIELTPATERQPKLMRGTLFGSHWVVDSENYVEYIKEKNSRWDFDYYFMNDVEGYRDRCSWDHGEPLAVDMESYGFFKTIRMNVEFHGMNIMAYAVRGISDLAADKGELDKKTKGAIRETAAANAMRIALQIADFHYDNRLSSFSQV